MRLKIYHLHKVLFILTFFSWNLFQSCQNNIEKTIDPKLKTAKDSVSYWINNSKNSNYTINKRKQFLLKSYHTIKTSKTDSSTAKHLSAIAYRNLKLGDTVLFKKQNQEALILAKKIKDSFSIGDTHWNYASFYNKSKVYDSAYYHFNIANRHFENSKYLFEAAKTQFGKAIIKGLYKDYSSSEILTINAIKKFKQIENYNLLHSCYNHLGRLQKDIKEYDKAIFYYNKSLKYLTKSNNKSNAFQATLNNIGNAYLKKGNYKKALTYFNKLLNVDSLQLKNIDRYTRVTENKAYCKLLKKDTLGIFKKLKKSLHIWDSLNNKNGITSSKIHLSHYFTYAQDTIKAINYAKEAKNQAKEIKNGVDYLTSLSLLAKLDKKEAATYLKEYIKFSDSLQTVERKNLNKHTRIAYETDVYIEKNERLSQQALWVGVVSFILIIILCLLYYIKAQRTKNERLIFDNEQQKANQQVYLLALKQQEKLEAEKTKERNRIAEELHDGILGKLFGIRVGLGFLDIKGNKELKKEHDVFLEELQAIEKEIRDVSHKLSTDFDSSQVGFKTLIRQVLENKKKISKFNYKLDFDDTIVWYEVDDLIKVNLYRITQEAIQNSIKHASAKNIGINFLLKNEDLKLTIKDDGYGFNTTRKIKGIGIKHMKSRTEKLNGIFNLYSKKGIGTTIEVQIPYKY